MDAQIDFQNIESPDLRQRAKNIMEELVQLCPSDASVYAKFHFVQDKFMAEINVASQSVIMSAVDHASALADALDHVKSKIMGQIIDWRLHRFA